MCAQGLAAGSRQGGERERNKDYVGAIYVDGTGSYSLHVPYLHPHTHPAHIPNEFGLRAVCVCAQGLAAGSRRNLREHAQVENARGRLAKICMLGFLSHFAHGLVLYSRVHVRSLKQNCRAVFIFVFFFPDPPPTEQIRD